MRILLISDTHGNNEVVDNLIRIWPNIDLYLHAGDSESHPTSIYPFRTVRGNCDYSFDLKKELIIPTPFGNILMRHKPEVTPSFIKNNDIKVFIYGHTHVRECKKKFDIAFVNPGAISYPRDGESTYAILENEEDNILVDYYSLETNDLIQRFKISLKNGD